MLRERRSPKKYENSMNDAIVKAFEESIRVKQAFLRDNLEILTQVIDVIVAAFKGGNKLLLFGNGGSAADAQHIAAEFTNRYLLERPPLPALALTTDTSALTAIANDYVQKMWPNSYAARRKKYDYEGGEPAALPPAGYIWTNAAAWSACSCW